MKRQNPMRSLASNSLILTASNVLSAVLGFLLSLIIGRGVGEAGFGVWIFCMAWAALLTMICEFGLNSLLIRETVRAPESANQLLIASLALKLILISILGGSVWLLAPVLSLNSKSSAVLSVSLLIAVVSVAYGSFTAIFKAFGWMSPILWLNACGGIFQISWSLWIIGAGGGVLPLIWAAVAVDLAQLVTAILLWWYRIRAGGGRFEASQLGTFQMLKDSVPFAISAFLGAIESRSSVLLLGYFRGETEVGRFGMASRFFEAGRLIPNGIYDSAFPALASGRKSAEREDRNIMQRLGLFIFIYTVIAAFILIAFSDQVIHLSYGDAFMAASPTLRWLGVAMLPTLHNALMEVYLFATGDEKYATKLGAFGLAVQIAVSIPLMLSYGASGAAMGILCGELVIWLPLQWRLRKLTVPPVE